MIWDGRPTTRLLTQFVGSIESLQSGARKVILENLPWDALQLLDLIDLAARTSSDAIALLLDAPDEILIERASQRRVCQSCERDPNADPGGRRCKQLMMLSMRNLRESTNYSSG